MLRGEPDEEVYGDRETSLTASAVSGQGALPPGPQWAARLSPPERKAPTYDKPLCASKDGFTLHAATRTGALNTSGREALLRCVLRPPLAQDKTEHRKDGLIRILLKRPYPDGTDRGSCLERRKPPQTRGPTRRSAQADIAHLAELLKRTFGWDGLACPACEGRMRLVAVVNDSQSIARYLAGIGEPTDLPARSPQRGSPYCKSIVLRRCALGYEDT